MATCAAIATIDGQGVFVPVEVEPCTSLLLLTPAEYAAVSQTPFVLSVEDGILVSGAVGAVWVFAWAVRSVRSVLSSHGDSET